MKNLVIWLMQTGETLPISEGQRKMRTALMADKFVARGHRVLWWASAFEHQRKIWLSTDDKDFSIEENYTIRLLRGRGYKKNISIARYIDHVSVARKFKNIADKNKEPDIIVASMPCYHLAYEAMCFARRGGIPLIVDIRDLWPEIFIKPLEKFGLKKLGRLALLGDFNKLSNLLYRADGITAISKGLLDWGLDKINRPQNKWDRVFYHGYKPNQGPLAENPPSMIPEFKEQKVFLFVGTFGESYELNLIVDVAKRFNTAGNKEIAFYLIGTGEQYANLEKMAVQLPNLHLPGWLDADQIRHFLNSAWAGIVPCNSVKNAAPNKVFEYLSAGLPLISSLEGEIADLIKRYEIGLNYHAGDAEGLYRCIEVLATEEQSRQQMSQSAISVFAEYGDADRIYDDYADYVEKLVENFGELD